MEKKEVIQLYKKEGGGATMIPPESTEKKCPCDNLQNGDIVEIDKEGNCIECGRPTGCIKVNSTPESKDWEKDLIYYDWYNDRTDYQKGLIEKFISEIEERAYQRGLQEKSTLLAVNLNKE